MYRPRRSFATAIGFADLTLLVILFFHFVIMNPMPMNSPEVMSSGKMLLAITIIFLVMLVFDARSNHDNATYLYRRA